MARINCPRCVRPQKQCLCKLIPSLKSNTRVWILQHPSEQKHALNTARFVALGLCDCQLQVAEDFAALKDKLATNGSYLLFPHAEAKAVETLPLGEVKQLIVLDGTWRKAKLLLHLNPWLAALPKLSLTVEHASRYRLRKAPNAQSLSTIEAVVACLSVLEPDTDFSPLLNPFEALIEGQISAMGQKIYKKNYQ
ncbi:DTW domain-containing protein [Pseudomonas sp. F1_0610]|uniref:tRNA-uridine aminocarboxypropyltransferase n=1 Tax=Pseudomonas sp. F1_0610 TaxID=3114284 RepID=UPI0039C14717